MDPVIKNIYERRSVRSFKDRPVERALMQQIIDAGNMAPSGANTQGWRFVVIEDKKYLDKLANMAKPHYRSWLETASKDLKAQRKKIDATHDDPVYYSAPAVVFVIGNGMAKDMDCPLVCENMMLAARTLGIGSCWVFMGQLVLADKEINDLLEVDENEKVFGPIIFGYPKNDFPPAPPKKPAVVKWV